MSLTGAIGPAFTGIETGLLAAAMTASHAGHARVAAQHSTAPVVSFPSGERIEPGTAPSPLPLIGPDVPIPAALKALGARIQHSPLTVVGRNLPGSATAVMHKLPQGEQTKTEVENVTWPIELKCAGPIAGPPTDEDLKARVERVLGLTGTGNASAAGAASTGHGSIASNRSVGAPRQPLRGGNFLAHHVMDLLNAHFLVGTSEQQTAIFRIRDDGLLTYMTDREFKLAVAHIFAEIPITVRISGVATGNGTKLVQAAKFWLENPLRNEKKIIFDPSPNYTPKPHEFNLWRGFGLEPGRGWQKQRRFVRHIREVICRRDKKKFKYLIRFLAWCVQNPDKKADVVIVLKSRRQGTGKSTLGVVMRIIFGQHGAIIDDSDRLLSRFNDWVEPISFILAEEILWAGDRKTADKLNSRITADAVQIEHKNGPVREIPNRLHMIMTTNHEHAVSAGVGERRKVVYDVSDEHACDVRWFGPLYRDLEAGGYAEFLWFLRHVKLDDWHPRQMIMTGETIEQQRLSADSVTQWALACIEAEAIIGLHGIEYDLGDAFAFKVLEQSYIEYCQRRRLRAVGDFGKACTEMFGPRKRLQASATSMPPGGAAGVQPTATGAQPISATGSKRPWGYQVPTADEWQEKIEAGLGIRKGGD